VRNALRPRSARHGEATFTLSPRPDAKQALGLITIITVQPLARWPCSNRNELTRREIVVQP